METSVSLLERLAGAPTDDDWRRLIELYQPLLRAWMTRAGVAAGDADDLAQDVLLVVFREVGGFERRGPARSAPGCGPSSRTASATISAPSSIVLSPPGAAPSCAGWRNWRSLGAP